MSPSQEILHQKESNGSAKTLRKYSGIGFPGETPEEVELGPGLGHHGTSRTFLETASSRALVFERHRVPEEPGALEDPGMDEESGYALVDPLELLFEVIFKELDVVNVPELAVELLK